MTWNYGYTADIWPPVLTVLLFITLSLYSGRRRRVPGALPFAVACLFGVFWAGCSVVELMATDGATQVFWFRAGSVWILPCTTAVTCFVLEYAWPGRRLTRRNLALLSIVPLLTMGLIVTNDFHGWVWLDRDTGGTAMPQAGPAAWLLLAYGTALGVVNLMAFVWLFVRSPQHRGPVVIMSVGQVASRIAWGLELAGAPRSSLPLGVVGIGSAFLMYAVALFAFRLFDPMPMARRTAMEQLHAGMLVLDPQGDVVSLNPFAERILGVPAGSARGRPLRGLLPACAEGQLAMPDGAETGFSRGAGRDARHYTMAVSPLEDWRGLDVGRLVLLRDVTEQKQAQERIVEQQRELATLGEREREARELHDSLGQVLGYASFQVDAAAKLSREGQAEAAAAQLDRLGQVLRDAHADVRQHILDLRSAPSVQQPFFAAVRRYLAGFTGNYDIQTHLSIDPQVGEEPFAPDAQLHAFRIVQEALANVRKHAHALHVRVTFGAEGGRMRMAIQDDGGGFAAEGGVPPDGRHFGLQSMQERAAQLGGSLQVESAPGAGTRVVLDVPTGGRYADREPGGRSEEETG